MFLERWAALPLVCSQAFFLLSPYTRYKTLAMLLVLSGISCQSLCCSGHGVFHCVSLRRGICKEFRKDLTRIWCKQCLKVMENWASHSLRVLKMFQKIHVPTLCCLQRKALKRRVLSGNSLRMEVCRIPTGTEEAEMNLWGLEGWDTWSCPALGVLVWDWDLLLSSELTNTQSWGNPPLPWARPLSIFLENHIYQLLFLA